MRSLALTAAIAFTPVWVAAQVPTVRPTPSQAKVLLETRPDLVTQLRQRFATSGMTTEQIHARLRAEGYPEDLLDPYIAGATGEAAQPNEDVFRAVRALGIADADEVGLLQRAAATRQALDTTPAVAVRRDSLPADAAMRDSGFVIFGLDVFRGATSQFDANASGAVDANYKLGPGDRLVLILTGAIEASYQLDVTREGFVVIPQVGQLYISNLTLGQLNAMLRTRLARAYSGISDGRTSFSISVAKLRSNQIYVVGDVQRPGSYIVSSAGTTLSALYAAGGPTVNGSLRRVEVRRAGHLVDTLDVYEYLIRGDAEHDVRLQTGDVVFVPVHGPRVRVVGEIVRPATYELKGRETLADLIRNAGGFSATAARQRVLVERIVPPAQRGAEGSDRITLDVSANTLVSGPAATVPLYDGDIVHVLGIAERVRNRIAVQGNVYQAGFQGLTLGMRLSDALRKAGGLQPDTYLPEVLITRTQSDSSKVQLRAALADTTGRVLNDLLLAEDDVIEVFSIASFRPRRTVAITGAVQNAGIFPYRAGMTLRDLLLLSGGPKEGADLREAEIARLPASRIGGQLAVSIRVPLDSTYLFERKANGEYVGPPGMPFPGSGAPDVPLLPYDNVLIVFQPEWDLQKTVVVEGRVRHPGSYALLNNTERFSDIIRRAGGFASDAFPEGTVIKRSEGNIGQVGFDAMNGLRRYESSDNVLLRPLDTISVPPINLTVTIRGAVNRPITIAYVDGRSITYYINAAGGFSKIADEGRTYVVQPGGKMEGIARRFFSMRGTPRPRPGSIVVVPDRDPNETKDRLALVSSVAQILTGAVALIFAITR